MALYPIGVIDYLNSLPINTALASYLKEEEGDDSFKIIKGTPASLNKGIASKELVLSPVSSIHYALHQRDLFILPHLSISSFKAVKSVLLFTKRPLHEIKKVALPDTSATSIVQIKILLSHLSPYPVEYLSSPPYLSKMLQIAPAALLIGDDALKASRGAKDLRIYDLGSLWYQKTGEVMVHALYVVQKEIAIKNPTLIERLHRAHLLAKEWGFRHLEDIIQKSGLEISEARDYYHHLRYGLGREEIRGLQCFFDEALKLSLLEEEVNLNIWRDGVCN